MKPAWFLISFVLVSPPGIGPHPLPGMVGALPESFASERECRDSLETSAAGLSRDMGLGEQRAFICLSGWTIAAQPSKAP